MGPLLWYMGRETPLTILSPEFFEMYRKARVAALNDIPTDRQGLKPQVLDDRGVFLYEDPWVKMTFGPKDRHYRLEFLAFYKESTTRTESNFPKIKTPAQACRALELEVRDYWTSPLHMLPSAPTPILDLFTKLKSKYQLP